MNLEDAKTLLKDYEADLVFEEAFGFILVKFKEKVSRDKWDKAHALVREAGGEYVGGMGANSHFRFTKTEEPQTEQPTKPVGKLTQTKTIMDVIERLKLIEQDLQKLVGKA